ncbi:MAG TPA: beta-xylosidase [Clostridiales bacterium]|nr:beta-xylosidase [Clostridiales bacterium]
MINYTLDYKSSVKPLPHFWETCVGSSFAVSALHEDYRTHLTKCVRELGFKYVRFHGIFDDDMGLLCIADENEIDFDKKFMLSFEKVDSVFDFLLSIGVRPYVEFCFMPEVLASGTTTIFDNRKTSPPKDYDAWQWLCERFTSHCVERYGLGEVRQWFFEVWNEPNIGGVGQPMGFWGGTQEEYFKLYKYATLGVKNVDSRLRTGGPATSTNAWIPEFVGYSRENSVPVDFVATHHYPTDDVIGLALEKLISVGEQVKAGKTDPELMAQYMQEFQDTKENAWERVPRGALTEMTKRAIKEADGLPVYYTEWNSWAGLSSDGPFGASFAAKTIMDTVGLVDLYCYWHFSDVTEDSQEKEFYGGMGLLTKHGVPKATYRGFELLHELGSEMYAEVFNQNTIDIYSVKKPEAHAVQLLVINHQSLNQEINDETIDIEITGLPSFTKAEIKRIDENNGNALKFFENNDACEISELIEISKLKTEPVNVKFSNGNAKFVLDLPKQGIALVTIYY